MGGFYRRRHIWLLAMQTFSPNFESISFVFYLAHGAQERYFHVFVLVATDVSFMKQPFHFRFALTDIFFFFFLLCRLPLPLPRCLSLFSVYPRALGVLPFLSFSLSLTQCVRRENWPHKKWKGLFKRNGSIMKTYYCIPWCAACGCRRWPAAILFS